MTLHTLCHSSEMGPQEGSQVLLCIFKGYVRRSSYVRRTPGISPVVVQVICELLGKGSWSLKVDAGELTLIPLVGDRTQNLVGASA